MIVTTIDPVTGNKVTDLEHHPYVVEGSGVAATKIYFESEKTRKQYLDTHGIFPDTYISSEDNGVDSPYSKSSH